MRTALRGVGEKCGLETGQYVDLYGSATFSGEALAALKQMLADAEMLITSQPDEWQVHVGTQIKPTSPNLFGVRGSKIVGQWEKVQELYKPVQRERFLKLIEQWEKIVTRAEELGRPVVCFGD